MGRRGMLVTAWAGATAVATLVAWAAVGRVTDEVAPSAALPLPTSVALAEPTEDIPTAPAEATERPRTRRRNPPRNDVGATQEPAAPAEDDPDPTVGEPADDPEPEDEAEARTLGYQLTGGSVTVRYRGTRTDLVQATPSSGFVVDIHDSGPQKVEVRFRSDNHESRFVARVQDGEPDVDREERPR